MNSLAFRSELLVVRAETAEVLLDPSLLEEPPEAEKRALAR
jgi:hypothetical protein